MKDKVELCGICLRHSDVQSSLSAERRVEHWGQGLKIYRVITWEVGLCSLPSTLISSGEQKEYWALMLTGSTGSYKVCSHGCDLFSPHLSELTVKPSDDGVTSRWNITGAAGVDCGVCSGFRSFCQEFCSSESSIPAHDLWKLLLYFCCLQWEQKRLARMISHQADSSIGRYGSGG